jgi:hypothetical protein
MDGWIDKLENNWEGSGSDLIGYYPVFYIE